MSKKRVFIYGSCVSRDTFEFLSSDDIDLTGYVARQSLISINRNCLGYWPENFALKSNFQNQMVRSDWEGDALRRIEGAVAQGLDALVVDFTDERFGVFQFDENTQRIVTRTIDMLGTPLEDLANQHELVEFGTELHINWFRWCLRTFAERLKEFGIFENTVILRVPWATETDLGKQLPAKLGLAPADANRLYETYYQTAEDLGFKMIDLSDFPVYAEPLHQWGLAPYHYTIEVYQEIAHQLRVFWGFNVIW